MALIPYKTFCFRCHHDARLGTKKPHLPDVGWLNAIALGNISAHFTLKSSDEIAQSSFRSQDCGGEPVTHGSPNLRLEVLLGQQPGTLQMELSQAAPIPTQPPALPIGLPSELLLRRPEIGRAHV